MTGSTQDVCPICGADPAEKPMYVEGPWRIVACRECSHGWTVPAPSETELKSAYESPAYYSKRGMVYEESAARDRASALRARFSGDRLLDIGCGLGSMLAAARDAGFEVVGTEFSEHAAHIARTKRGLDVRVGPFTTAQFEDERFNLITLTHVLEHVRDPGADLVSAHSRLAPRGQLFVEVPNPAAWAAKYSTRWKEKIYDLPLHLSHFSVESLDRVLRQAGFADVTVIMSVPDIIDRALASASKIRRLARRPHSSPLSESANRGGGETHDASDRLGDEKRGRPTAGTLLTTSLRRRFPGYKLIATARKT